MKKNKKRAANHRPTTLTKTEIILSYPVGFYNGIKEKAATERGRAVILGLISGTLAFIGFELIYSITIFFYCLNMRF